MTFAVLRALHSVIGDAIDDIQRVYAQHPNFPPPTSDSTELPYTSPPPSPHKPHHPRTPLDFPSLDALHDPADPAEQLRAHPLVMRAIAKIVSATGHISAIAQTPFMTLMDASLGYHLPSCLRLVEAANIVEFLREAGLDGLHVDVLSRKTDVDNLRLAHILRLLATHHILRERVHNVFTLNRISSMLDSGKSIAELQKWENEGKPEMKYHGTNGIAAFIGLNTDDLLKTSAYMTEAYLLGRTDPPVPPFQYAFGTEASWFPWLEGEGVKQDQLSSSIPLSSPARVTPIARELPTPEVQEKSQGIGNSNRYRLERFGAAMQGTGSWESPGAVLHGLDWRSLPRGSVIVDVGGGIGSTSMLLANAFARPGDDQDLGFKFIVQDRPIVVELGEKAWRTKYPELLDSGTARFQAHDFFDAQPVKNASVFLLRVILHDWTDAQARKILERLRTAATENTKLLMGDFVLPLACPDDGEEGGENILDGVEGAEKALASPPLLANLGKASSHAYWMDMTMQTVFNAQERTLRETVTLARSAGWKVVKVTRSEGSLFGYIIAVPTEIPPPTDSEGGFANETTKEAQVASAENGQNGHRISRVGTPTFGSRLDLPSFQESRLAKLKSRVAGLMIKGRSGGGGTMRQMAGSPVGPAKKKPSFPSSSQPPPSPTSPGHLRLSFPKQEPEGLRKRSGSGFGASMNGVTNFLSSRRSGILNFGDSGSKERESPLGSEKQAGPGVLAEAAEIGSNSAAP